MKKLSLADNVALTPTTFYAVALIAGAVAMAAVAIILLSGSQGDTVEIGQAPDIANATANACITGPVSAGNETRETPEDDGGLFQDVWSGRAPKHIAYASQANVSGITVYTAYWDVPERPAYNEYIKHTVFLWCGLQQGELGLIQSVLEWDHDDTGKYWTIACWIVNRRDGTYEVGRRFAAYPGDRIRADLRYITDPADPGRKVWFIAITDETQQSMAYLIDYGGAVDTNQNLTAFNGVLEGIGLVRYDADLPGDVTFEDIVCRAEGNVDIPLNLTGYVHPDMGQVAIEYDPEGTPVIIRTHYQAR